MVLLREKMVAKDIAEIIYCTGLVEVWINNDYMLYWLSSREGTAKNAFWHVKKRWKPSS